MKEGEGKEDAIDREKEKPSGHRERTRGRGRGSGERVAAFVFNVLFCIGV